MFTTTMTILISPRTLRLTTPMSFRLIPQKLENLVEEEIEDSQDLPLLSHDQEDHPTDHFIPAERKHSQPVQLKYSYSMVGP